MSARNIFLALDRDRFDPLLVGIDKQGRWRVEPKATLLNAKGDPRHLRLCAVDAEVTVPVRPTAVTVADSAAILTRDDVVFPVLHGTYGEDGTAQGLFELGNDDPQASLPGEIIITHKDGYYSCDAKYVDPDGADFHIPADIPQATATRLQTLAIDTFRALELSGMARVDFFIDRVSGAVYINEVNTILGLLPFRCIRRCGKPRECRPGPLSPA